MMVLLLYFGFNSSLKGQIQGIDRHAGGTVSPSGLLAAQNCQINYHG